MANRQTNLTLFIIIVILLIVVVYLFFELRMTALREKLQQAPVSALTLSLKKSNHFNN